MAAGRVKENFWEQDAKPQVLKLVKELMESTLKEERTLQAGRLPYQRNGSDIIYRNGYYRRGLVTQFSAAGLIRGVTSSITCPNDIRKIALTS